MIKKILALLLLTLTGYSYAAITDGKFGVNQIFDVQYYWQGTTLHASNFIAPYDKNFQTVTVSAGQYFQFFASTTNPGKYGLGLYNSNGSLAKVVHDYGDITALGDGAIFYIGSGFFGNVISTAQGYSYGSSASFTNMDRAVDSNDLNNYTWASTTPLASGQTAQPAAPTYGVNFTRITSYEWKSYAAGSEPVSSEKAHEAFDNNDSKWFGFKSQGAWVVVQLVTDGTYSSTRAVQKIQFRTANDAPERDPTGYRIWGSIDGVNWVLIKEEAIALPAGRNTDSPIYELNNVTAYSYYRVEFTGTKGAGDAFQINEIRLIYDVDDPQGTLAGGGVYVPPPLCCGGSSSAFNANAGFTTRLQTFVNRSTNDNQVYIEQIGNFNTITVQQTGSKNNYVKYFGNGSFNNVSITQSSTSATTVNYIESNIGTAQSVANSNTVNLSQNSTGGSKGILVNVTNSNNLLTIQQTDSGNHYAEVTLSGGNKTVNILQQGSANHMANINLAGTTTSLDLTQSGSIQQYYSIIHTCSISTGCGTISVTQGN
jgi:hypothetical protein